MTGSGSNPPCSTHLSNGCSFDPHFITADFISDFEEDFEVFANSQSASLCGVRFRTSRLVHSWSTRVTVCVEGLTIEGTSRTSASVMDHQTILKSILEEKYDILYEEVILPSRLCYRNLKHDYQFSDLDQQEFRYVEYSCLHPFATVPLTDILSCDCKHKSSKKTIITLGVCGVGKSTTVRSCALEWAEGTGFQDIHLMFPFTFWELSMLKQKMPLILLLQSLFPGVKNIDASSLNRKDVWFVFDGLDEYHHQLKFDAPPVRDVYEVATVDVLITSLIRGTLLPNAHIWITTGYAAAGQIPGEYLLKETQLQGFSDVQKMEKFHSTLNDNDMANRAIDHVKISWSLASLCLIPRICIIMALVLESYLCNEKNKFKISPLNLTQIYTVLMKTSNSDIIPKLQRMALLRLTERNVIYEEDLLKCDISVKEASTFAKKCPLMLMEEKGVFASVFRFGHSSFRDFFAACAKVDDIQASSFPSTHCQAILDEALRSDAGKMDVFLRFIFGLLKERRMFQPNNQLFKYTKKTILEKVMTFRAVGLLHCLREYDRNAFVHEIKLFLKYGFSPIEGFAPLHWHLLIQRTIAYDWKRPKFVMDVSMRSDESVLRELPAIMKSTKVMLGFSNLTDKCCAALAAVLSSTESFVKELDLGYNNISDSGVKTLVEGLNNQNCRLRTLSLQGCEVTSQGSKYLATALSQSQRLRQLDLSRNNIGDNGLQHLSNGLRSPECQLLALKLSQCNIEERGCSYLASALEKNSDSLSVLDLSINMVGDKGASEIFKKFDISKLTKLEMYHCGLTASSCRAIGEALRREENTLSELNLSNNNLEDEGLTLLSIGNSEWCPLEKLNISRCGITAGSCSFLPSMILDLNLSMNSLGDDGVKYFLAVLKNPFSYLQTLNLSRCSLTHGCCAELASTLASKTGSVTELDLSENDLQDKGLRKLCVGLRNPQCKLQKLSLQTCGLTSKSIQSLISALRSNPKYLAELHLMGNRLEDSDIRALLDLTKNQTYTLHTTDLSED
ncbi:NACHT, LRR and PYD domains-containing protein 14 isoform X2 [Hippoglossus stenolepis]|uniref:NACHT, LRR and PYD domains-containing protein 14 isoform X2 n=1 Tax=Hippoglossus stenolepis TaxID=195615 RepID=UPI001FAED26B|nr:NACHT, LRR and PYD domains-containing protein 14 isoform X2 [Hippoglossus stenolepis]